MVRQQTMPSYYMFPWLGTGTTDSSDYVGWTMQEWSTEWQPFLAYRPDRSGD
jgi:hypothetical protein